MYPRPRSKFGLMIWNKADMPEEEFMERISKIKQKLEEKRLDALIMYTPGLEDGGNCCYVSNVPAFGQYYLVLPKEGQTAFIGELGERNMRDRPRYNTWIKYVRTTHEFYGHVSIAKEIIRVVEDLEVSTGKLGLVGANEIPFSDYENLIKGLPKAIFEDVTSMIDEMRLIKSEKELAVIKKSANVADSVYEALVEGTKEGRSGIEISADMDRTARYGGSPDIRFMMATGLEAEKALRPNWDSTSRIKKGDTILMKFASQYDRYWSELGRTVALPPVSNKQSNLYAAAVEAQKKIIKTIRPGVAITNLVGTMVQIINETGYGNFLQKGYGLGHGIGLDIEEKPNISEGEATHLKTNMVLSIGFGIHIPKVGGIVLNDVVLITDSGSKCLLKSPYQLEI